MPRRASPRRKRLLEAATTVTADHGLRGLTHRAVDRQAGLPEGSCSAYFRTRSALQTGLATYVADQLTVEVARLSADLARHPGDTTRAVERTTRLFLRWLRDVERVQALLELTLEATRNPELADLLTGWRATLVEVVECSLVSAGPGQDGARAETLVGALYGVLLGALLQQPAERKTHLEGSLALLFEGLTAPSSA